MLRKEEIEHNFTEQSTVVEFSECLVVQDCSASSRHRVGESPWPCWAHCKVQHFTLYSGDNKNTLDLRCTSQV